MRTVTAKSKLKSEVLEIKVLRNRPNHYYRKSPGTRNHESDKRQGTREEPVDTVKDGM